MPDLPFVTVKHPSGEGTMVINQRDYDANPDAYELAEKPKRTRKPAKAKDA